MDKYTVRDSDGSVNVSASANAYAKALSEWVSTNETPVSDIADAVNAVLDQHGKLTMPMLQTYTATQLGASPTQFTAVGNRARAWVRSQAEAGVLVIVKGKNGGVSRAVAKTA